MILAPVRIHAESILERFEESLNWFLDGNFLSYKNESACFSALCERIVDYELLCRYGDAGLARTVGQKLIERMQALDHDTDDFPDVMIRMIEDAMPEYLKSKPMNK
jgi:hypothetical protein